MLDDVVLVPDCPQCGRRVNVTIGQVKRRTARPCPRCGLAFTDGGMVAEVRKAEKALDNLVRRLG